MSNELREKYRELGWVVAEGIFSPEEADEICREAMDVSREELKGAVEGYAADRSEDGTLAPRKIDNPFLKSAVFRRAALNEKMRGVLEGLLGRTPLLARDQIFMKPPRFGSAKPYHQDNAYFLCSPPDDVITAWIALDDVDGENGCLRYIDGSHRLGLVPHEPIPGEPHNKAPRADMVDLSRESLGCVRKGGVLIHHGWVLHTSHRNESDRWRRAYATHWVTDRCTSEAGVLDEAIYKSDLYPA
ncbi:MAG: hypothetical protein DRP71_06250 [Verrucomicrobia bacterium]|nr:MAG: hypothetical protein DRP71_06250 [Verrucomicrobiota bacterium]